MSIISVYFYKKFLVADENRKAMIHTPSAVFVQFENSYLLSIFLPVTPSILFTLRQSVCTQVYTHLFMFALCPSQTKHQRIYISHYKRVQVGAFCILCNLIRTYLLLSCPMLLLHTARTQRYRLIKLTQIRKISLFTRKWIYVLLLQYMSYSIWTSTTRPSSSIILNFIGASLI